MSKSPTAQDAEEEEIHFSRVIATFRNYLRYSLAANNRRRKDLFTIPRADRELIGRVGYKSKLDEVDKAIKANADFLDLIVSDPAIFGHNIDSNSPEEERPSDVLEARQHDGPSGQHGHSHDHGSHSHSHGGPSSRSGNAPSSDFDMDKLRSTIKQFVRDWSAEGKEEREQAYAPMKEALLNHFSDIPPAERGNFRVLVPGCGLARLAYDIAKLGFACQANEFSHYMLLPSFHILNRTDQIEKYTIYPYVHSFSNVPNRQAMLRAIRIPDVLPSDLPSGANFSLVAGDFEEIYGETEELELEDGAPSAGHWDAVVTCFFIDTAKNVVNYLRIIHQILAPGGVWINLGPLLWHFENNNTNDPSIELDLEEVKTLCREIGFDISNERTIPTTYCSNSEGMLGYVYETSFWTATKRP